ncbi:MAG: alpha/beta hydrolase [Pseudomonadota bacterium]
MDIIASGTWRSKMFGEVTGSGESESPWLVMVHGMSQNRLIFDRQVERFSPSYRILLIDLPGHGIASAHPGPFGHLEYADHVAKCLDANGIEEAHYWGTHTGTAAGLLNAVAAPERFLSLILEGPVLPGQNVECVTRELTRARKLAATEGVPAAIAAWWSEAPWFDFMRGHPGSARADKQRAIVETFSGRPWLDEQTPAAVPDIAEQLAQLHVPTQIYTGAFDHPDFITEAGRLEQLMARAERKVVPSAGGFPAWENPNSTNALVGEFLKRARRTP